MACSDTQWTTQETCFAAGACSNTTYVNDESGCNAEGTCSDATYDNDIDGCVTFGNTWTSAGNTWTPAGNTWVLAYQNSTDCIAAGGTWDFSYVDYNYTTVTPTIELESPIDPDYYVVVNYPVHAFLTNQTGGRVMGLYGYSPGEINSSKI